MTAGDPALFLRAGLRELAWGVGVPGNWVQVLARDHGDWVQSRVPMPALQVRPADADERSNGRAVAADTRPVF